MLPLLLACLPPILDSGDSAPDTAPAVDTGDTAPDPVTLRFTLTNTSAAGDLSTSAGPTDIALAPGLLVVHDPGWSLFTLGAVAEDTPLEPLAEDGDPTALQAALAADPAVREVLLLSVKDDTTYAAAPMHPGEHASVLAAVSADENVSFLAMFGQSNDVVVATAPGGVAGLSGDGLAALSLGLYDVGTEVNQEPGAGSDQAPRQAAPDTGAAEGGTITALSGTDSSGWTWPDPTTFATLVPTAE